MKNIGVFTSGGDSPGMNACIRAVVRTALANGINIFGIKRGFQGMIENDIIELKNEDVSNIIQQGGTILKTARSAEFHTKEGRQKAYHSLKSNNIEGLVCIGGNGTYTGSEIFFNEFGIPSIGLPGTIDNDLFGTDYTIGFDTAVNTAMYAIDKIRDTADAHNRIFFVEVMGRDSGFIGLNVGLSSGAESILLPEVLHDFDELIAHFNNQEKRKKRFSIIVVSEGEEEGSAFVIAEKFKQNVSDCDVKVSVLGHVQRGGSPTANDRILASRLGNTAVLKLLEGKSNLCVGVINNELTYTPFKIAITNKKEVLGQLWNLAQTLST
jgi:6-phosphofructokinase 1